MEVEDDIVRAKFDPTLDVRNYIDCGIFKELVRGQPTKEALDELIKEANEACKKEGWQLKLVKAQEYEKNEIDYWIKTDGTVPTLKHPKTLQ